MALFKPDSELPMSPVRPVVRIVNWNLLAFDNAKNDENGFPLASEQTLSPQNRQHLIRRFLKRACEQADFITLQEVDDPDFVAGVLSFKNFAYFYEKRQDSPLGLLIAWDSDKYDLVQKRVWRYHPWHQIGVLVELLDKSNPKGHTVVVATTHLKAGERSKSVRDSQAREFFSQVQNASEASDHFVHLTLMAGDFNNHGNEWKSWSEDEDAYSDVKWTTRKQRKADEVIEEHEDFIFHDGFLVSVLDPAIYLDKDAILPNETFPSDHILMVADIGLQ